MKLTPENRKALEDMRKDFENLSKCPSVWQQDITQGCRKFFDNHHSTMEDTFALLLEIWEPLAEMVEARGKCSPDDEWRVGRFQENGFMNQLSIQPSIGVTYGAEEEAKNNANFIVTAANALAAIRKAVG